MSRRPKVVLIAEDDDQVRVFVARILRHAGYTVLESPGGLEAIAVAASYPREIALAILDIVMPGIGGLDVANQLAMDRPTTKILYVSGFGASIAVETISQVEPKAMLHKPFTGTQLLAAVREILSGKSPG